MGQAWDRSPFEVEERLARLALDRGFITPEQLQTALDARDRDGVTLAEALLGLRLLTNGQMIRLIEDAGAPPLHPPLGRFTLVREIGRGASAVVYDALDGADGRHVALKIFHATSDVERFVREGVVASKIPAHPGIVPVYEAGEIDGRRYISMELVDGVHMDQWIRRGSVTFPTYLGVLRDAALAVDHAHRYGVIHRDLKPENILVDAAGRARVVDFGLAKSVSLGSTAGMSVGTPAYMSPEQIQGKPDVDRRADVWALGVMLYEGLTGERPFPGRTAFEVMQKAVEEPPPPPAKHSRLQMNPLHFGTVERIALRALSKDPKDRHPGARDFADDLGRWLRGESFDVQVAPPPKKKRSRKVLWPLAAAALLGAAVTLFVPRPEPKEAARPALAQPPGRPGAVMEYYGGIHFNTLGKREIDVLPRFAGGELWPEGPEYYVSRRWTGRLRVAETGPYVFGVRAHEGARLVVARSEVVNNLIPNMPTQRSGRVVLQKGLHEIVLECFHSGAPEAVDVTWGPEGKPAASLGPADLTHDPAGFIPVAPPAVNGPVIIPGAQEGETLEVVDASGRPTATPTFAPFRWFWRGRWSGQKHLWWGSGTRKGDALTVRFQASAGRRALVLGLTRAMDHGVFGIAVNGHPTGRTIDLYSADLATEEVELPNLELREGANQITFRVVDSNPAAREWGPGGGLYKLGLDYLVVR